MPEVKRLDLAEINSDIHAGADYRRAMIPVFTRRALEGGCSPEDIRHVVVLATTTLGFPSMMATMTWVDDVLERS